MKIVICDVDWWTTVFLLIYSGHSVMGSSPSLGLPQTIGTSPRMKEVRKEMEVIRRNEGVQEVVSVMAKREQMSEDNRLPGAVNLSDCHPRSPWPHCCVELYLHYGGLCSRICW